MIHLLRAAGMLGLMVLGACSEQQHPLERHLSQLRPVTVATLPRLDWPTGTVLCPLAPYQSELPASEPLAQRVNAFLKQKQFKGDEGHWSLIAVKPTPNGDAGIEQPIEQLSFKRADFDVINDAAMLERDAETVPAGFALTTCVPVEHARVLVTRLKRSNRTLIIFGRQ